jgi:hypothetical protein
MFSLEDISRRADAMLDWLETLALEHAGAIPSWLNPRHPGYPYPEAAGLWLTALSQARPNSPAIAPTVRWLESQVEHDASDERSYVGRDGRLYAFDSAMTLSGLLAARNSGARVSPVALESLTRGLVHAVEHQWAGSELPDPARHWSDRWGCHQLKLAWALSRAADELGSELSAACRNALVRLEPLRRLERDGRFFIAADDGRSYVHASCYALEGLMASPEVGAQLRAGARWLASIQEDDGSLPCWLPEDGATTLDAGLDAGRRPSDVIAQAIRIWTAVDARAFAKAIDAALSALFRRQGPTGALSYLEPDDSPDLNSWCTIFAAQALRSVLTAASGEDEPSPLVDRWLA